MVGNIKIGDPRVNDSIAHICGKLEDIFLDHIDLLQQLLNQKRCEAYSDHQNVSDGRKAELSDEY